MPIEFNCVSCSRLLRVPDGSGGKSCQCPGCGALLEIPMPGILIDDGFDANASDGKLHIPCPQCKHHLVCEPKLLGTKGQCRNCKHIFTISNAPADLPSTTETAANWVFSCPKCNQLFEGQESMNGRRGKCHSCGDVFDIKLRVAQEDASRPPETEKRKATPTAAPPTESAKPTGAFSSSSVKPKATSNTSKVSKPANVAKSVKAAKPVAAASKEPIRFNCSGCAGTMEVPGATIGQLTICPYCKIQLKIPPSSTVSSAPPPSATAAPQASGDIWSNLDVFGPTSTQPANAAYPASFQPTNYAPPGYAPINYQTTPYATPRRSRSSNNNTSFMACGILIIISSALEILYLIYQIGSIGFAMSRPLPPVEGIMIYFGIAIALMVLGLVLVIVKLFGGIAMVRRAGLASAKTGAIISCLPCLCCIVNVPIGIWACILTFSSEAERHFSY